ncbi:CoA transferase [Pseudomonas sp. S31]|uniref:CaiB/BaiF CoA transferase family protein n=1 Tax=Pseudomonas sp. S31 TaxID=1564473 RepID=UPI001913CF9F|nr:CoA transferase [Pseudomonas sp. S31]MBK4998751.1 CoA transferase [Pseudomonas sp. S31]
MSGYDFLNGLRVLEVAQLGPSSLGGYLADMGAQVIKVEGADGDPVRRSGQHAVGAPDGLSFLHLRWNRGKRSLGLNLKHPEGAAIFLQLAAQSDVVIEGMRAGVLERLGLGYETLREQNPKLVFCSLSGLGSTGPYHTQGSHGPSFDAFGALSSLNPYALPPELQAAGGVVPVGMHAMGLNAALGTLSALLRAQRTGQGAYIEVSGAESAAHWLPDAVNASANAALLHERPGFLNSHKRMAGWPRLSAYRTRDERGIFFQGLFPRFWNRFCEVLDRPDLAQIYQRIDDSGAADEAVHVALSELFASRDYEQWMALFVAHDIPAGPANSTDTLVHDPHFLARDNLYEVEQPGAGHLRLSSSPVKTSGQRFAPGAAPEQWQDSSALLREHLGLDDEALARLQASEAIYLAQAD